MGIKRAVARLIIPTPPLFEILRETYRNLFYDVVIAMGKPEINIGCSAFLRGASHFRSAMHLGKEYSFIQDFEFDLVSDRNAMAANEGDRWFQFS
jgi:hypothetical protein